MPDTTSAKTWDADFTAEAFDEASADLLRSSTWDVGLAPDLFLPVVVEAQTPWRPGSGTEGRFRLIASPDFGASLYPGMPMVVRVDNVVVGRATVRSVTNERRRRHLHPGVLELEWWIMDCGLPDLIWARLRSWTDGTADVLTTGGELDRFPSRDEAVSWLCEDEFRDLEVFNQGEFEIGLDLPFIWPPEGESDAALAPLMFQRWQGDLRNWRPQVKAG